MHLIAHLLLAFTYLFQSLCFLSFPYSFFPSLPLLLSFYISLSTVFLEIHLIIELFTLQHTHFSLCSLPRHTASCCCGSLLLSSPLPFHSSSASYIAPMLQRCCAHIKRFDNASVTLERQSRQKDILFVKCLSFVNVKRRSSIFYIYTEEISNFLQVGREGGTDRESQSASAEVGNGKGRNFMYRFRTFPHIKSVQKCSFKLGIPHILGHSV